MESPEYIRLSLAADMTLGFRPGLFWRNARMTCINLLLTYSDGCRARCSYCGLERLRKGEAQTFIRVPWETRPLDDVIKRIAINQVARRVCISMITHPRAVRDTLCVLAALRAKTALPISCLISPTVTDRDALLSLKAAGADKIGIAFDLATKGLFDRHRGSKCGGPHKWHTYWQRFEQAVDVFSPGNVGSHFIVGLGETEQEIVGAFGRVHALGGVNHLFSFYPEPGTTLEHLSPPPLDSYRRIQIACHLIDEAMCQPGDFEFDPHSGKILGFGIAENQLEEIIASGVPFMTRGCTGADGRVACNRPFANSLPGPELRNYPFQPTDDDLALIKAQLFSTEVIRS
jgi:biotin synthase-related radical SAM superfamily protein